MKINSKIAVLTTVGTFALAYAIVGSNAFADTAAAPVSSVPSVTIPTTPSTTPSTTPLPSRIQAPAGLTSPSAGITQDDEDEDFNDPSDIDESGINDTDSEGEDGEISSHDVGDQENNMNITGNINQSDSSDDGMGDDD